LTVGDVRIAVPAGIGVEAGMVALVEEAEPQRQLRIVVAQPEARAISSAWRGDVPPRPSTWDLLISAVALLEGRVDRAVITAVEEERHWFASIELETPSGRRTLACRPSDAVALALRSWGAGIFAHEEVLASAGVLADGSRPAPTAAPTGAAPADSEVDPGGNEGVSFG
jgi:bifunctional DNase/RNase